VVVCSFSKSKADDTEMLSLKVGKYISSIGYKELPDKNGFDLCAKKSSLMGNDKYISIGFNQEDTITASYINNFNKKLFKFSENLEKNTFTFGAIGVPEIEGLIAYTGDLPKQIVSLIKDHKPAIQLKKF
jgi:hypothetical protein